jgi:hypothetical protein
MDSTRGIGSSGKFLFSDVSNAEDSITDYMMTFNTDGFSVGAGDAGFNASNDTYVTWQWKANGGTTSSNSDGSITSTVQANTTAGFSIVTFTGTGSVATVGHGLGVAPNMIIAKNRDTTADWVVKHHKTTNNYDFLNLNTTSAPTANDSVWTQTDPTTSVFSIGTASAINQSSTNIVAYCFAEKQGYSKFGKYTGGGSMRPFVYTGFSPAWVMIKDTSQATNWEIFDVKRNPSNVRNLKLGANTDAAENGSDLGNSNQNNIDILSNGFKLRTGNTDTNVSGDTYIYMAFGENPFVTSTGIPTTAR